MDRMEYRTEQEAELIMLGTGHAMVTKCYNTCFALRLGGEYFLVDAGGGNGILVQMEAAGISFGSVHRMFVTHAHTDHILGAVWVIRKVAALLRAGEYQGELTLYCHDKVKEILDFMCGQMLPGKFRAFLGKRIFLETVEDGDAREWEGAHLTFFDIGSTKEKQFGFAAVLPDGVRLACLGDEPYRERNRNHVFGCDWLLSEAFCLDAEKERYRPYEKHHSTALDAGKIAAGLGVGNLVLYHTEDGCLPERKTRYTQEARRHYAGNVYVPEDLERISLTGRHV